MELRDCKGQGTVEFAIVLGSLILLVSAGLYSFQFIQNGALVSHAEQSATFALEQNPNVALFNAFLH